MTAFFEPLIKQAQAALDACPGCHDWDHTIRVLSNARHICRAEGADAVVVDFAAVLHDIGRPAELADQGKTCHAEHGASLSADMMRKLGITDEAFIAHVTACVRTHRFRRRGVDRPATLEACVVYDADKLDCIGAIGIGRSFHFAGRIGARVHNTDTEANGCESYSRDDSAYREYLVKLRHVQEHMLTTEGARMAAARHRFMVAFFDEINREVRGEDLAEG